MGGPLLPGARFEPPTVRAIARERVDRLLDRAWQVPLTVVVGPAGAGKTTAASHLVQRNVGNAVWYRAHAADGAETVFAEHLSHSIGRVIASVTPCADLGTLLLQIERTAVPLLVVIDEFDALIGTGSEVAFEALLADLSPTTHFVSLSRHRPSVNLSRLRLTSEIGQVGPDDLRFRSWEVDRLFRELYQRPLRHDEVAELERRTGGWVAALQLFNLATRSLPAADRRAAIAQVGRRSGPDWDFLADNVLRGLPDELQLFLLETAPLERLTAPLCDTLLDERRSARWLAELERLQLVTSSMETPGSFRAHEVLRAHLHSLLIEWEGTDSVLKRYRRAAETLEEHGHAAEALRAYCHGEDWSSASRVLGTRGAEVADHPGSWIGGLPRSMVDNDPWLLLTDARRLRAGGRIADAIATYQRVENGALTSLPVSVARRERLLLASLLDHSSRPSLSWVCALRDAAVGDPVLAAAGLHERSALELLASGVAHLLAADVIEATALLRRSRDHVDASPVVSLAAQVALLVASHLAGTSDPFAADDLERAATTLDVPFLARLCRAAGAMVTGSSDLGEAVVADCDRVGDATGAAICSLLASIGRVWGPATKGGAPNDAPQRCRALGLRTLEVWAQVADALDAVGHQHGRELSIAAEASARRRGLRLLQELAELGVRVSTHGATPVVGLAGSLTTSRGIAVPNTLARHIAARERSDVTVDDGPALRIQCLGRFTVSVRGTPIELSELRPRARAVLRMLSAHVDTGVHRHTLCDELWPEDEEVGASRKLQVAISSIRRALELAGAADVVRRRGDMYVIGSSPQVDCDVRLFTTSVAESRVLMSRGAPDDAIAAMRRAREHYAGDLLPEDGANDWVVAPRRQLQATARDIAHDLATALLDRGHPSDAVEACRWGLKIDRFSDPLWRLLLEALEADNDPAGHARAVAEYDGILDELGIHRTAGVAAT